MLSSVVVVQSFKRYLLEYLSFWIYSRGIPFVAWVLCVLLVHPTSYPMGIGGKAAGA
jgi:hypothetical protein